MSREVRSKKKLKRERGVSKEVSKELKNGKKGEEERGRG